MTAEEVQEKYHIPYKLLQEYHSWGMCNAVRIAMDDWQYTEKDLENLSMIMVLHDLEFEPETVELYMRLFIQGAKTKNQRMRILNRQREKTLDEIHLKERQLERMDYLRHEIRSK